MITEREKDRIMAKQETIKDELLLIMEDIGSDLFRIDKATDESGLSGTARGDLIRYLTENIKSQVALATHFVGRIE